MNQDSKKTEVTKVAHTVTEQDHEQGLYTKVAVGDVIVFVVETITTVESIVVEVELDGKPYTEEVEEVAPVKKKRGVRSLLSLD